MQITKQADYALRAMLYLARMQTGQRSATKQIAETQKIPPSFLAKIISQLSIAGLIHTSRGAHGGVVLSKSPSEISLLEVVEAIDGPISLNDCTISPENCTQADDCPLHGIWVETQQELVAKLKQTTFDKFVR